MLHLLALGLHGAASLPPAVEFDGGSACSHLGARVESIFETHRESLPEQTRLTVRIHTDPTDSRAMELQIAVHAGRETTSERQAVNSCREALGYLDLYLGFWTPEPVGVESGAESDGTGETTAATAASSRVGVIADLFANATTSHSSGLGFGLGGGLSLNIDWARIGMFASWSQPSRLAGSPDQAQYTLQRWDWGALFCGETYDRTLTVLPCGGASARAFSVPAPETAPGSDRYAQLLSLDAGVAITNPVWDTAGLQALVLLRYAPVRLKLEELAIGDFVPPQLEVNLRLGFTWDMTRTLTTAPSASSPSTGASRGTQAW